jgi:hypothetical protein
MMEAVSISGTFVNFYETTWSNIPEDTHLPAIGVYPEPGHIYITIFITPILISSSHSLNNFHKYNNYCFYFEAGTPNGRCHPEAQYYKINFRKKKEELCSKLFKMYNDKIFDNKVRDRNELQVS